MIPNFIDRILRIIPKKLSLSSLFLLYFLALPSQIYSDTINASSLSRTDIQTAVNIASLGDVIVLPTGTNNSFSGTITVPAGIEIRGQGPDKTILRRGSSNNNALFIFDGSNYENVKFSGIKLQGTANDNYTERGLQLGNDCKDFRIWNCEIDGFTHAGIYILGHSYGVIWECSIKNCYTPGYGYGIKADATLSSEWTPHMGDSSWERYLDVGGSDAIYIEDCTFSNCRHCVDANMGGRFVVRYSTFLGNGGNNQIIATHGETSAGNRGTRKFEVYENIITHVSQPYSIFPNAGSGVVFNNSIVDIGNPVNWFIIAHPCCGTNDCGAYPERDQVSELYIWGNTVNGVSRNTPRISDHCLDQQELLFVENRDWFEYPMPGYTPFPYPHSLRGTSGPSLNVSRSSISFNGISGGGSPGTQSFTISNTGGGILDWSVSKNRGWLQYTPFSGTGYQEITVSVDPSALGAGSYSGTITVTSPNASNSPSTIAVNFTVAAISHEVTKPNTLTGASSGTTDSSYSFSSGGSSCSQGHNVQYRFDWGDGTYSAWSSSVSASHQWADPGVYAVAVQARCISSTSVLSQWYSGKTVSISTDVHEVSTPDAPTGASSSEVGTSSTFSTGGAECSRDHNVQYRFRWGDGTYSSWSSSQSASHAWTELDDYVVQAQARCANDTSIVSTWSAGKNVQIKEDISFSALALSTETHSTVSGIGGYTDPNTGSYSYSTGSYVQMTAVPNTNYRFSKWTGSIHISNAFKENISLAMDRDRSLTAHFYTQCGDVNGDLSLSPVDAQLAFEIFLGKYSDPSEAQLENADVNCDGTQSNPSVTPKDAHAIFNKYLGNAELPGDCSCSTRTSDAATMELSPPAFSGKMLSIADSFAISGQSITLAVKINDPSGLESLGFDVIYDPDKLNFVGINRTNTTNDFVQLAAHERSSGIVRIGGYRGEPITDSSPAVLLELTFQVLSMDGSDILFLLTNAVDDIEGIQSVPGRIFLMSPAEPQYIKERKEAPVLKK